MENTLNALKLYDSTIITFEWNDYHKAYISEYGKNNLLIQYIVFEDFHAEYRYKKRYKYKLNNFNWDDIMTDEYSIETIIDSTHDKVVIKHLVSLFEKFW